MGSHIEYKMRPI